MPNARQHRFSRYQAEALDVFRCVLCHAPMASEVSFLSCSSCGHRYPVSEEGIIDVLAGSDQKMTLAQRAGQWKLVARNYDVLWRHRALSALTGRPFSSVQELDLVAEAVGVFSAKTILDNACGNAFYGRGLAQRMQKEGLPGVIIANDSSFEMLKQARKLASLDKSEHRILFVRSDSENMPFRDGAFDGVACGGSLNEFSSPLKVLSEFQRVMATGATASVMFQVLSQNGVVALAQQILGAFSGLKFLSISEASNRLSKYFDFKVLIHEGVVLIARLSMAELAGRSDQERGRSTMNKDGSMAKRDLSQPVRESVLIFDVNGI